jgi:transposase-like protein
LPRYRRLTVAALALIASADLAGVNTRRVRRALGALFGGAVSKDGVSRAGRPVQTDFEAWNRRALADEPIVRLILAVALGLMGTSAIGRRRRRRSGR